MGPRKIDSIQADINPKEGRGSQECRFGPGHRLGLAEDEIIHDRHIDAASPIVRSQGPCTVAHLYPEDKWFREDHTQEDES